jgi:serine/threonine protein kinase
MWALGCVLYNLCSLVPPFDAPDFASLTAKIMNGEKRPLPRYISVSSNDLLISLD